jgi:hypothetical protein
VKEIIEMVVITMVAIITDIMGIIHMAIVLICMALPALNLLVLNPLNLNLGVGIGALVVIYKTKLGSLC